jgi:hypothetical protein
MGTEQFALTDEKTGATTGVVFAEGGKVKSRPRLRIALKENFTARRMAKNFLFGAAGVLILAVAIRAVSSECQGS